MTVTKSLPETPLFDYFEKIAKKSNRKPRRSNFPGPAADPALDDIRLAGLQLALFNLMKDGQWRTHGEMRAGIGRGSENGIAALLRNFRSKRRGEHTVNKRRRGQSKNGLWEYQLEVNDGGRTKVLGS